MAADKYERRHRSNLSAYEREIDRLYRQAVAQAAAIGASLKGFKADALFSFDDYPAVRKRVEKLLEALQSGITAVVTDGIKAEWELANDKDSELVRQVFGDNAGKLTQEQYSRYFSNNDDARKAFEKRKVDGLGLSDRVWRYTDQFKEEIELGLDIGIRNGLSTDEMSRELRQYLKYPDKLFRRVRDEHGELRLSKRAAAFHPGRGVYRSSYKNARRLAATETNIAYRTADHERRQQLDFVVGIEIKLSKNHPEPDICDDLKGRYPKDFKFTGWHPQCRCYTTSILKTKEELAEDTRRILAGEALDGESVNRVDDVPEGFKQWIRDNEGRYKAAEKRGTLPYFIKDNKKVVDGILAGSPSQLDDVISAVKKAGVDYLEVANLSKTLTTDEIINRLGGGDLTKGSCSSLAFSFAGNRGGLDVLDFRSGESCYQFSLNSNIRNIIQKAGGMTCDKPSDIESTNELLKTMAEGKEYYLRAGRHAAIVRRTKNSYEYLELQSAISNGFKPLNNRELRRRFKCQSSHTSYGVKYSIPSDLIDIDLLIRDSGFRKLLGYINTSASKQKKGESGTIK